MIKTKLNIKKILKDNNNLLPSNIPEDSIILTNKNNNKVRYNYTTHKNYLETGELIKQKKINNFFLFLNNDNWVHVSGVELHKISKKNKRNVYRIKYTSYYDMFDTSDIDSVIRQNKLQKINKVLDDKN